MAEKLYINKIRLNGQDYYIKDEEARAAAGAGLQLIAVESVEALGLASADTMGAIYLVPHSHAERDIWDEYVTVLKDGSYSWERLGTTDVDLSGYAKDGHTHQVTSAVSVADIDYTPEGEIEISLTKNASDVSVTGSYTGEKISYTPAGTITVPNVSTKSFSGTTSTFTGSVEAEGEVEISGTETAEVLAGVQATASGTNVYYDKFNADYQADGETLVLALATNAAATVAQPTINITTSKKEVVTAVGTAAFTGTATEVSVSGVPEGNINVVVDAPAFQGETDEIEVKSANIISSGSVTPDISVSAEFNGQAASLHPVVTNGTVTSAANSN